MVGFVYLNLSKRRHKGPGTLLILEEGINLFCLPSVLSLVSNEILEDENFNRPDRNILQTRHII